MKMETEFQNAVIELTEKEGLSDRGAATLLGVSRMSVGRVKKGVTNVTKKGKKEGKNVTNVTPSNGEKNLTRVKMKRNLFGLTFLFLLFVCTELFIHLSGR
jgi:transposase